MTTWLLTSTTYGTWLPGDARGSVTSVRDRRPLEAPSSTRTEHDRPGEEYEPSLPLLRSAAAGQMKGPRVLLTAAQARRTLVQFLETAKHRRVRILAAAIMANHFHLVVIASAETDPGKLLGDFKAYASRALNRHFGKPAGGTWWTAQGSRRKLPNDEAVAAAVNYVLNKQPSPLVTWSPADDSNPGPDSEPAT